MYKIVVKKHYYFVGNGIEPGIISAWDADGTEIFKISSSLKERIMAYLPFDVQQELNESRLDLEREEREERAGRVIL